MANIPPIPRVQLDVRAEIEEEVVHLRHCAYTEDQIRNLFLRGVRFALHMMARQKEKKGDPDGTH